MWLIYVALLIAFVYILDYLLIDKRLYELAEKFNGPKRWPLIGNAHRFFGVGPKGKKILEKSKSKTFYFSKELSRIDKIWLMKSLSSARYQRLVLIS